MTSIVHICIVDHLFSTYLYALSCKNWVKNKFHNQHKSQSQHKFQYQYWVHKLKDLVIYASSWIQNNIMDKRYNYMVRYNLDFVYDIGISSSKIFLIKLIVYILF